MPVIARQAVGPLVVDEQKHIPPGPAAGVFEGDGLLNVAAGAVDFVVVAVQVAQAVVVPHQRASLRAGTGQGAEGQEAVA
ncbi:hypothetical protein D3C81_1612540 [compost metagenome]